MKDDSVIVVGAGIAGLTAAALLASEGQEVTLLESHFQIGGCAGTFRRGNYIFDVGATQVAGFELGGIHERIFRHLQTPLPPAQVLKLACLVDLGDRGDPVRVWHDPLKWQIERKRQFPGSDVFWDLVEFLHRINWDFAGHDPILPIRNLWDLRQSFLALSPLLAISAIFTRASISDLLNLCGCKKDIRLKRFLDMQLQLYSQESADRTAALYGSTVLNMAQSPLGLWHLQGSMQVLSDNLSKAFISKGGKIFLRHSVSSLEPPGSDGFWKVNLINPSGERIQICSSDVVFTPPPQSLIDLIEPGLAEMNAYIQTLKQLPTPTGALVFYGAIERSFLPDQCPAHIQLFSNKPGNLFVSISREGDGRAPRGFATVIASCFTDVSSWNVLTPEVYKIKKAEVFVEIRTTLENQLNIRPRSWQHEELATPCSFAKWTSRPQGIVGGLGQTPDHFGPFGLASRTPLKGLWLCGDSLYPGEGTAGVSQSALMACRQLLADRGILFRLPA